MGTALCWTVSSLNFTVASRQIGSLNVNLLRLGLALVMLTGYGWVVRDQPWPTDAPAATWWWLLWSGVIGFFIGDLCLFEAFVLVGARLSTLMISLSPPLTALLGWLLLGERLGGRAGLGMGETLAGVGLVLREQPDERTAPLAARRWWRGILLGVGAAAGQAVGLVLGKLGMQGYDAFGATQIRVVAGLGGFVVLFAAGGRWGELRPALARWSAVWRVAVGAVFGPFVGVGLALLAVQHVSTGVAATIIALVPVFVIPPAMVWQGERVGWRAMLGTAVAVSGVVMLCW